MARMKIKGGDEFSHKIAALQNGTVDVMKKAVYAGANVLADAVAAQIQALPEQNGKMPDGEKRNVITNREKSELISHLGISHISLENGRVSNAIGFEGYTAIKTRKYTQGVPIPMIARSIESGSSVRMKNPFMRRAGEAAKARAQEEMIRAADDEIEKLTK